MDIATFFRSWSIRPRFKGSPGIFIFAFLGYLAGAGFQEAHADSMDPKILLRVQAATFEVVAAKPIEDNLVYDKPLPLDLLPYQERNDKYYSVGTAFAIGNNRYVTAAHVLDIGVASLWGKPELRDTKGNVYSIDKIEKFSLARDFVVFSLIGHADKASLQINSKPEANSVVYAVGNALGTGVVIRDGLYTSTTPEEQDGRWKWMRFSAAASPGNSGGPLLDNSGKVIGVVLRKSPNENLNFALPIDEVMNAPDRSAEIDNRISFRLDTMDTVHTETFKDRFALPLTFDEFSETFAKLGNAFSDAQINALMAKESERVFPKGPGSSRVLHSVARMQIAPAILIRQSDGDWVATEKAGKRTALTANGYVMPGSAGRSYLFHLHKPDDLSSADLYGDPEKFMNLLLKSGFMQRPIGTEKIQVIGMGKPFQDESYVDTWQRKWRICAWRIPFANSIFMTFSLPVPDGYVTVGRYMPAFTAHENMTELKVLTDFVTVGYQGTRAQWKEFLANTAILPAALQAVKIELDKDNRLNYSSARVSFSFGDKVQIVEPQSLISLGFGFINDGGKIDWDVGDIRVDRNADSHDWINVQRHVAPSDDLDESYKSTWSNIVNRRHPYDGVSRSESDSTRVTAVVDVAKGSQPKVLYTSFVGVNGSAPQSSMKGKVELLAKTVHVTE
jgi:serine protease Do